MKEVDANKIFNTRLVVNALNIYLEIFEPFTDLSDLESKKVLRFFLDSVQKESQYRGFRDGFESIEENNPYSKWRFIRRAHYDRSYKEGMLTRKKHFI